MLSFVWVVDDEHLEFFKLNSSWLISVKMVQNRGKISPLNWNTEGSQHSSHLIHSHYSISVDIKLIENLFQFVFLLLTVGKSDESLSEKRNNLFKSCLEIHWRAVFRNAPGLLHHHTEVVFGGAADGEVGIVIKELFLANFAIVVTFHTIKAIQELSNHFLFCHLALLELLVVAHIVEMGDVLPVDDAWAIFV